MTSSTYGEPGSEFAAWLDAYQLCSANQAGMPGVRCPRCSRTGLRLIYLVPDQDAESGTAVFWCDQCLFGLLPFRAPVPPDGARVLIGTEQVPDYSIVVDDSEPIE